MRNPIIAGSGLLAGRAALLMRRNPASMMGAVIFPLLFFTLFMVVMRRVMEAQGFDYVQLLPSTVVIQAAFFTAMASAAYIANDRVTSMSARFRSLPIARSAPFLGRAGADSLRAFLSVTVLLVVGVAVGMRFEAGLVYVPLYIAVAVLFAVGASMAMGLIGYLASSPMAASSIASVPYLPLLMLSSGFAPVDNFPSWLQPFVEYQPVTAAIDALRALTGHGDILQTVSLSVAWSVGLIIVFGVIGAIRAGRTS